MSAGAWGRDGGHRVKKKEAKKKQTERYLLKLKLGGNGKSFCFPYVPYLSSSGELLGILSKFGVLKFEDLVDVEVDVNCKN